MTNLILTLIVCSTVITSIVNVAKPAYKKFAGKYAISITTLLSFLLGILSAFSLAGYLEGNPVSFFSSWILRTRTKHMTLDHARTSTRNRK